MVQALHASWSASLRASAAAAMRIELLKRYSRDFVDMGGHASQPNASFNFAQRRRHLHLRYLDFDRIWIDGGERPLVVHHHGRKQYNQ